MVKNLKKCNKIIISLILILSISVLMGIINYSNAASFSITSGINEITVGKKYTIKITATGLTGKFNITHSDNVSVSKSSIWVENGVADGTITVTTKSEGKATVTLTPDSEFGVSDSKGLVSLSAKTDTVTVKPKETKPKFTSVNQTVYAKSEVNVRESYTTSSTKLGSLQAGDSVTRTGIGSNGWSKVTYNGKTAYINSSYLTTTKPAIDNEEDNEVEEETTTEKSSNNLLKSLTVTPEGLTPIFDQNIEEYELTIGSDIDKLKIDAVAEDEKAKVTISGNKDLKLGKNTITITVTAEDKTKKTYEIVVTKEDEVQLGLKELLIEGLPLNPTFSETIYEYTLDLDTAVEELNITATASRKGAEVEIVGNTQLQPGENLITVLVTEDEEVVTYQITVNLPEIIEEENTSALAGITNEQLIKYGIIGIVILILIIFIIILIKRKNNDREDEEIIEENNDIEDVTAQEESVQGTEIELPKLEDEDLPKSLRKNNEQSITEEPVIEESKKIDDDRESKIEALTSSRLEYEDDRTRKKKGKHF